MVLRLSPTSVAIGLITVVFVLAFIQRELISVTPPQAVLNGVDVTETEVLTSRIVAVGDLHGDIGNARKVLEMADVIDSSGKWSGKVDIFVQTGDIIDRGDDTIKLFLMMEVLRAEAERKGGRVLSHLGNHEWMNAIGDWRFVPESEIRTFGSVAARQKMLSVGRIGRAWAKNYTTATRLPLHSLLGHPNSDYPPVSPKLAPSPLSHAAYSFVHGGLAPQYPQLTPFPSAINNLGSSLLQKLREREQPPPHPPNPYPGLPRNATEEEHRLYGTDGPLWYRGWALNPEAQACQEVGNVLRRTGTRRMIMGHTPDLKKIVSRCDGRIIIIDTGISHAYGGALSALSIEYTLERLPSSSAGGKKWKEKEIVKALYEHRHEVLVHEEKTFFADF